jgi:hypothetical protein
MTSRKRLNVAMIGQGFMGRAHSNAFHQVGHFCESSYDLKLKVICGRNQPQLEEMAARWGWEEVSTNWEEVVARKDLDAIDICTPNYLHAPIAISAAQAGKIVLCDDQSIAECAYTGVVQLSPRTRHRSRQEAGGRRKTRSNLPLQGHVPTELGRRPSQP